MSLLSQPLLVSVLLHKDGNAWVAQCLQKDIAAQGPTLSEAKSRFLRTLRAQIQDDLLDDRVPLSGLPQAPPQYFNKLGNTKVSGPDLPVWVPVSPKLKTELDREFMLSGVTAQFLKAA